VGPRDMRHIGFKSEPWFFDQLLAGRKTWDARIDDMADDRIYALHFSHTRNAESQQDVESITFANTFDHSWQITFRFDRLEYAHWAPGWCFLILGERVETPVDVFFGTALDIENIVPQALLKRTIGRVILAVGRWVLPKLIMTFPKRLQNVVKRVLPCVFSKSREPWELAPADSHVWCFCEICEESSGGAAHHLEFGTHSYQAPENCGHPVVPSERRDP